MAKRPSGGRPWWSILTAILTGLWLAGLAMIPLDHMTSTYLAEREAMIDVAGEEEDRLFRRSAPSTVTIEESGRPLSEWFAERNAVTRIWGNLVAYRISILMAWLWALLPVLLAIVVDAYCVREIRKYQFVAQSPLRNKLASRIGYAIGGSMLMLMLVPARFPPLIVPIGMVFIAGAFWLWVINLQKRL